MVKKKLIKTIQHKFFFHFYSSSELKEQKEKEKPNEIKILNLKQLTSTQKEIINNDNIFGFYDEINDFTVDEDLIWVLYKNKDELVKKIENLKK